MKRVILLLVLSAGCQAKPVYYELMEVRYGQEKARDWAKADRSIARVLEGVQRRGSARSRSMADWRERRVDNIHPWRIQAAVNEKYR